MDVMLRHARNPKHIANSAELKKKKLYVCVFIYMIYSDSGSPNIMKEIPI